ncbi:MAG TPA: ABC transporter substrate-binding protein [Actinophytocola sp.]|uniref:ABC transporter substrate-binding protein n=1 Tax=Actinophytocola sp. TaxID=1872138 RepID=UPI002DBE1F1C|nr:ABC transporter substrate-binding protein [Actinophytocola sp.]HEU5471682.1 ABC transporter substrate-binding protein [Actinophytocola sp.]
MSLTGCGLLGGDDDSNTPAADSGSTQLEKPNIKVSVMTTTDLAPFWLAVKNGYFKEAGFTFDPLKDVVVAKSGGESVSKLTSGDVDIAYSSYTPFFVAKAKGAADIKLVSDASSAGPNSCVVVAMPDSSVKTIQDMAGKRVAVTARNTISDLLVMSTLKTNKVPYDKIQWTEVPFPATGDALKNKQVDAAFVTEPFLTAVQRGVGAVPVFDTANGPTSNMPTAGFGAKAEFTQKNPKTLAAWQKVMLRATEEAKADRSKVEPLLVEYSKIDADTAKLLTLLTFQSALDATRIQRVPDLMLEFGVIDKKIDVSEMIAKGSSSG